jgi:hypothetical protein
MMAAVLVLISVNAVGADNAEAQSAKPEATNAQEHPSNPTPKEEAASKKSSESSTSNEEPNCN